MKTFSLILITFNSGKSAENKKCISRKEMLKRDLNTFSEEIGTRFFCYLRKESIVIRDMSGKAIFSNNNP